MAISTNSIFYRFSQLHANIRKALRVALLSLFSCIVLQYPNISFASEETKLAQAKFTAADVDSKTMMEHWYDSLSYEQGVMPEVGIYREHRTTVAPAPPSDNLWLRLRELGSLITPSNEAVAKELKLLLDNKFWTTRNLKDAEPYLHYVLSRLEARNLPLELALLPIIESNYNPAARSHLNAMGLWQLVPATAKSLGLTIDQWTDERKDIQKSTEAALDYLEKMYASIGNWPLTVAAYNAGPSRIRARVKKVNKEHVEVWDVNLPDETRRYVAKFFALNELIRRQEELSFKLPTIPANPVFVEMHVNTRVSLKAAAELAEMPVTNLSQLNHDLLKNATPPSGPHSIVVPISAKETFQANLEQAIRRSDPLYRPTFYHTVAAGDSLSVIAAKHQLSISEIQELNKLKSTKIRIGQKILLFAMNESESKLPLNATPEYKVRKGDTLSGIASLYGVRRSVIAKTNNINNADMLRVGKILVIPANYIPDNLRALKYTVKSGDTLSEIAQLFKVSLIEIKRLNPPLADAHTILPGQKVFIPKNAF